MLYIPEEYKNLLEKTYKKHTKRVTPERYVPSTKKREENCSRNGSTLDLANRVETIAERDAFLTLKDHKASFRDKPTCHLINSTKSEMGKISKRILQKIVKETATAINVNLWRSTQAIIEWFNNIQN